VPDIILHNGFYFCKGRAKHLAAEGSVANHFEQTCLKSASISEGTAHVWLRPVPLSARICSTARVRGHLVGVVSLIDAGLLLLNRSSSGQHGHNDLRWSIELHIVHHPSVLRAMH